MNLTKYIWLIFGKHKWSYRNPYNRTCIICDKHEVSYCRDLDHWNQSWWEVHSNGKEEKHYL